MIVQRDGLETDTHHVYKLCCSGLNEAFANALRHWQQEAILCRDKFGKFFPQKIRALGAVLEDNEESLEAVALSVAHAFAGAESAGRFALRSSLASRESCLRDLLKIHVVFVIEMLIVLQQIPVDLIVGLLHGNIRESSVARGGSLASAAHRAGFIVARFVHHELGWLRESLLGSRSALCAWRGRRLG